MKKVLWTIAAGMAAIAVATTSVPVGAQTRSATIAQYAAVDLGTFGGPTADGSTINLDVQRGEISAAGTVVGEAETAKTDPHAPNMCWNEDCYVGNAFTWAAHLTDLGVLPDGANSQATWISGDGHWIAGTSTNGLTDSTCQFAAFTAVAWKNGVIRSLGTFGGQLAISDAVNNKGLTVGWALNKVPDQFSNEFGCAFGRQIRAFLWQPKTGKMHDLGTLGGPDAIASVVNGKGPGGGPVVHELSSKQRDQHSNSGPIRLASRQDEIAWHVGRYIRVLNGHECVWRHRRCFKP